MQNLTHRRGLSVDKQPHRGDKRTSGKGHLLSLGHTDGARTGGIEHQPEGVGSGRYRLPSVIRTGDAADFDPCSHHIRYQSMSGRKYYQKTGGNAPFHGLSKAPTGSAINSGDRKSTRLNSRHVASP